MGIAWENPANISGKGLACGSTRWVSAVDPKPRVSSLASYTLSTLRCVYQHHALAPDCEVPTGEGITCGFQVAAGRSVKFST